MRDWVWSVEFSSKSHSLHGIQRNAKVYLSAHYIKHCDPDLSPFFAHIEFDLYGGSNPGR